MISKKDLQILLINSDPDFLTSTSEQLKKNDYNITSARGTKEAIDKLDSQIFHLIIANLYLRDGDGPKIMQWAFTNRPHIRSILTSEKLTQDRLEGLQEFSHIIGSHRALAQPFSPEDLIKVIQEEARKF